MVKPKLWFHLVRHNCVSNAWSLTRLTLMANGCWACAVSIRRAAIGLWLDAAIILGVAIINALLRFIQATLKVSACDCEQNFTASVTAPAESSAPRLGSYGVVLMLLLLAVSESWSIPVPDKTRKTPPQRCHRAKPICICCLCSWLSLRSNAAECQALFSNYLLPRYSLTSRGRIFDQ